MIEVVRADRLREVRRHRRERDDAALLDRRLLDADLFAVHNGEYMAKSTLMAIQARMACYTGQMVTWEQALNSREDLSPAGYTFDSRPPAAEVAMPGVTRLV